MNLHETVHSKPFLHVIVPVFSAMIGILIASWSKKKWTKWVPVCCGTKGNKQLLIEYNGRIKAAHWITVLGFLAGASPTFSG